MTFKSHRVCTTNCPGLALEVSVVCRDIHRQSRRTFPWHGIQAMKEQMEMAAPEESGFPGYPRPPVNGCPHAPKAATASGSPRLVERVELTACDRSVLLTAIYADLFDFPLTRDELFGRLIGTGFDRRQLSKSLTRLIGTHLSSRDGLIFLRGRSPIVGLRQRRRIRAEEQWSGAARYAGWLAHVPFMRMVAISGSLAVDNANRTGDVDFFCVTDPRRLWLSRLFVVPLSKLTRLFPAVFPMYMCPNYVLSLDALYVQDQNLFTAHEVLQAVPLFGEDVFRSFVQLNGWARGLLPNLRLRHRDSKRREPAKPLATRLVERILAGRAGDVVNHAAYRAFTGFYRRRARHRGWDWDRLAPAYQLERYTVPEGGYVSVIADLFRRRVYEVTGDAVAPAEIDELFPGGHASGPVCYDWEAMYRTEYGAEIAGTA